MAEENPLPQNLLYGGGFFFLKWSFRLGGRKLNPRMGGAVSSDEGNFSHRIFLVNITVIAQIFFARACGARGKGLYIALVSPCNWRNLVFELV